MTVSLTDNGFVGVLQGHQAVNQTRLQTGTIKSGESLRLGDIVGLEASSLQIRAMSTAVHPSGVIIDVVYRHDFFRDNPLWTQDDVIPAGTVIEYVLLKTPEAIVPLRTSIVDTLSPTVFTVGGDVTSAVATPNIGFVYATAGDEENKLNRIGTSTQNKVVPSGESGRVLVRLD